MILALKTVVDLSEADVVSLIQVFVSAHCENKPSSEGAMQVDESTSVAVPSLPSVLSLCLSYPTSAAALRLAIRQQLRDSKDLTCILQILSGWLDSWCEDDVQLLPERTKKDLHGALVPVLEDKRKDTVPPVNNVLAFLQTLLDSSYLTFLSYQPSHDLLQHVLSQLLPEVTFSDEVEQLRGPLMPFVKAHTKAVHESAHGVQKPDLKVDWKRRRKQAHEQASIAVGVYQIEELVL
ncbi:hypothetical protein PHLCEN_2v10723 [Hermanssonia centrifuga]|uniref:Uncharacterized protein n=1 Tax=Hermanssonia centrifuga TaxID=98765 RepID=A0A2R6NM31_9APHY|nr:hypothetical protein PHLCEN_2v10723 [Hermanssonia centrifuga]